MKKIFVFLSFALFLYSCNQQAEQMQKLTAERDSLLNATGNRDSSINQFLLAFNEIEKNLNVIKEKEQIINVSKPGELTQEQKERINEDILEIYKLIKRYKWKINKMKKEFKAMNIRIDEMNRMISSLNKRIKEKDEEIETLKLKLSGMNILVDSLFKNIDSLYLDNEVKKNEIAVKTTKLNSVYYVVGSKKELVEKNIIDKKGLLGKNISLQNDFNKEYFTLIDASVAAGIPIFAKKATVITNHPSSSFSLNTFEGQVDSLKISNKDDFWSITRYCVIIVE